MKVLTARLLPTPLPLPLSVHLSILLRCTHCDTRLSRKNVLISFWRIPALLYVYKPGSGPQRVQTVLFQVCDICNDVVRLHALADRSGNHGQSSQCTDGRPCRTRTRMPSDPLCVCQVHRNRTTFQPVPVSQSGGDPAPHRCFQAVPCSQTGHQGNPS